MKIQETNSYSKLEKNGKIVRIISENLCFKEDKNLSIFLKEKKKENTTIFYENENTNLDKIFIKLGEFFDKNFYDTLMSKYLNIFEDTFLYDNIDSQEYETIYVLKNSIEKFNLPSDIKQYYIEKVSPLQNFLEDTLYKKHYNENFENICRSYFEEIEFDFNNLIFWSHPYDNIIIITKNINAYTNYFDNLGYNTLYYGVVEKCF